MTLYTKSKFQKGGSVELILYMSVYKHVTALRMNC